MPLAVQTRALSCDAQVLLEEGCHKICYQRRILRACGMTFPLFKARFLAAVGSAGHFAGAHWPCADPSVAPGQAGVACGRPSEAALAHSESVMGPAARADRPAHSCAGQAAGDARTELQARREKLALFDKQCSRVIAGLYVGSDTVARSRDALRAAGITHVINCVCTLYPAYFSDELTYLMLNLHGTSHGACALSNVAQHAAPDAACPPWTDTPAEDVLAVVFDVFDFIEVALAKRADAVPPHCRHAAHWGSPRRARTRWRTQGACSSTARKACPGASRWSSHTSCGGTATPLSRHLPQ